MTPPAVPGLVPAGLAPAASPAPDDAAEPQGFLVAADDGARIHFLDWGGPVGTSPEAAQGVLLVPGLLSTAWAWSPVARRVCRVRTTLVSDLRGHGLADAPPAGYDLDTLAGDVIAVAEASGVLRAGPLVLAGHGFGATIAAAAAARLGDRCRALVLVDGGWERTAEVSGLDADELLRGLDEPPEVLRSMDAWLADRRAFDPASWDADQERAAREAVVETASGRLVRTVRPHVLGAYVRTMLDSDPMDALREVAGPVTALVALAAGDRDARLAELRRAAAARAQAGRSAIRVAGFASDAHNLMRYRPDEVCAAILGFDVPA